MSTLYRLSLIHIYVYKRQGLKKAAIYMTGQCTGCHPDRFFSHRKEQGFTGRMMSVIGMARAGS